MPKAQKVSAPAPQKLGTKKVATGKKAPVVTAAPVKSTKKPTVGKKEESKAQKSKALVSQLKGASLRIKKAEKVAPKVVTAAKTSVPKKPQTSFQIFTHQMQTQMKSMPKFNSLNAAEKTKVIRESWDKINEKQKQGYADQANDQKKIYDRKMKKLGLSKPEKETKKAAKVEKKRVSSKSTDKSKTKEKKIVSDVCKPKMVLSTFFLFGMENRKTLMKETPDLKLTEVAKKNGEAWKKLTEDQKKPYEALHQKDIKRHEKEMKEFNELGYYTNAEGVKSTFMDKKHRVQEFAIGTVMPKQVKNPFMIFMAEASTGQTGVKVAERAKKISEQWHGFTPAQKKKYELLSKKDHDRHDKQMADLRMNGFFTDEAGVKSTDMVQKVQKAKRSKSAKKQ